MHCSEERFTRRKPKQSPHSPTNARSVHLANGSFKGRLLKNMGKVSHILADPYCKVIRSISINCNLIEVNADHCWSIKERCFLESPISEEKIGLFTPRALSEYDPQWNADPKYFREILENSLMDSHISEFCDDFLKLLHFNRNVTKTKFHV